MNTPEKTTINFRHIVVSTAVGLAVLLVLWFLGWKAKGETTDPNDWYEIGRAVVFAFAAIGAVPAGYIAYRRQQTLEEQHALDRVKHQQEETKEDTRKDELQAANHRANTAALRARFAEASAQLGHDKAAIRLAGVYAMAELADDWANHGDTSARQQCADVLCAYLRMPFPASEEAEPESEAFVPDPGEVQVRETLVRVIAPAW